MTWVKGKSGNPAGKPKKGVSIPELIRAKLDEKCPDDPEHRLWRDVLAEKAIRMAMEDDNAMKSLLDRLYGRPTESLELTGKDGGDIVLNFVPAKQKEETLKE